GCSGIWGGICWRRGWARFHKCLTAIRLTRRAAALRRRGAWPRCYERSRRISMAARKTERVNVWLTPEQVAWLKTKENVSETVRAMVTEAMNLERLAQSVKGGTKKKSRKRS